MVYLDHNATTTIYPAVKSKMDEYAFMNLNPSSIHASGRIAKSLIENARTNIMQLIGCQSNDRNYKVTFTSSGTEANNLIISNYLTEAEIFISAVEHLSLFTYAKLYSNVTIIAVDSNGLVDLDDLKTKLSECQNKTKLVSVMLANNETGIIQPIEEISNIAKTCGALIHSDCAQAIGKIDVNIVKLGLDFITISGHKFGGPVGAAALIHRSDIHLKPLLLGGGQEQGLRAGTENVLALIGLGAAAVIALKSIKEYCYTVQKLRDKIEDVLVKHFDNIKIVGKNVQRLPNTILFINPDKTAETQLIGLDMQGVEVSSGSACSSGKVGKSHVLSAMGYTESDVRSAIRISLGITNTEDEIEQFLAIYNDLNK